MIFSVVWAKCGNACVMPLFQAFFSCWSLCTLNRRKKEARKRISANMINSRHINRWFPNKNGNSTSNSTIWNRVNAAEKFVVWCCAAYVSRIRVESVRPTNQTMYNFYCHCRTLLNEIMACFHDYELLFL